MTELGITTRAVDTSLIIELDGVLDLMTIPDLQDCLRRVPFGPGHQLIINLARITFCDSSGISALIAARNHATAGHGTIALCAVPSHVMQIFRVVGLNHVFPIHTSTETALASWSDQA